MLIASAASAPLVAHVVQVAPSAASAPGWFEKGSISFSIAAGLPSVSVAAAVGLLAFIIGRGQIAAAKTQSRIATEQRVIADDQRRIAAAKLNLDLFEERFVIFEAVLTFVSDPEAARRAGGESIFGRIPKARLLFGDAIVEYIREGHDRAVALHSIDLRMRANGGGYQPGDVQADLDLISWFEREALTGIYAKFGPFLDFSTWSLPSAPVPSTQP